VLPDVLIYASSVWATEPRSRPGANRATALMLSCRQARAVEQGAASPLVLRLEREDNRWLGPPFPPDRGMARESALTTKVAERSGDQLVDEAAAASPALRAGRDERAAALCGCGL
jgi:hypothetical protein